MNKKQIESILNDSKNKPINAFAPFWKGCNILSQFIKTDDIITKSELGIVYFLKVDRLVECHATKEQVKALFHHGFTVKNDYVVFKIK